MKKSLIICEGPTDLYLLQNLMINAYGWGHEKPSSFLPGRFNKDFLQGNDSLTIAAAGDSTKIKETFEKALTKNVTERKNDDRYQNIVVVTDNDEDGTETEVKKEILEKINFIYGSVTLPEQTALNEWIKVDYCKDTDFPFSTEILIIIIPPTGNGALETFLLNAMGERDAYDKAIIDKGNRFVDTADEEKRYLKRRRSITKAKFNVFMSIRTALVPYKEQESILKDLPWKDNGTVKETFRKLEDLSE